MRVVALVLSVLFVAGCGGPDPAPPPRSTAPTTTTTTTTRPAMSEELGAKMGAASTMLTYCTPGLPGDRLCDWGRISVLLTEVTTGLRPDSSADLTAALDAMNAAVAAFAPCTEWFNSSAATGDQVSCDQSWYGVTHAWGELTTAAHWP